MRIPEIFQLARQRGAQMVVPGSQIEFLLSRTCIEVAFPDPAKMVLDRSITSLIRSSPALLSSPISVSAATKRVSRFGRGRIP